MTALKGFALPRRAAPSTSASSASADLDPLLLWPALALLMSGLVMVYPASIATAEAGKFTGYQSTYFLLRHAVFLAVGLVAGVVARVDFAAGVSAGTEPNLPLSFDSTPPSATAVGEVFLYNAHAVDPEGKPVIYQLLSGPEGMTVDPLSGLVRWTVPPGAPAETPVTLLAFDALGAVALQRFAIVVAGGNEAPRMFDLPSQVDGVEGSIVEFTVSAADPDLDRLAFWADNLPAGASFDPSTRVFSWLPGYDSAGTYPGVRFFATDGISVTGASVTLLVAKFEPSIIPYIATQHPKSRFS